MKTRYGFIANSSSSSFIVIGYRSIDIPHQYLNKTFTIGVRGENEFGWQKEMYKDFYSRVNFICLQAMYMDDQKARSTKSKNNHYKMNKLKAMLKKYLKCSEVIVHEKFITDAYIDHQSSASENENIEMFDDDVSLYNFIFSNESYIQCDNDN